MKLLPLASDILYSVIVSDVPFGLAVKNAFKNKTIEISERSIVTSIVGCSLRHYMVYNDIIVDYFGDISEKEKIGLYLLLSDALFINKFAYTELINNAVDALNDARYGADEISSFVDGVKENPLISEKYEKNSPEFLALRFNTPLWLTKMWRKHYGPKVTYAIMKANSRPPKVYVETASSVSKEDLCANGEFSPVEGKNVLLYNGKSLNKNYGERNDIIPCTIAIKSLLDSLDIDPLRGLAIYSAVPNSFYLDIMLKCGTNFEADFIAGNAQTYFDVTKNVKKYGLKNLHIYEEKASSIITCISRPVNMFIVSPASSNFALLRSTPDYFLRVDQNLLDSYIKEQETALTEAGDHVAPNGTLVYFVSTISLKESNAVVERYLDAHPEFTLTASHQAMPFDGEDSTVFYAVMTKSGDSQ